MKFKLFSAMAAASFIIFTSACGQPLTQPRTGYSGLCAGIEENIKQAQSIASKMERFDWGEFSDVGILCPPQGICPVGNLPIVQTSSVDKEQRSRVVALPERLPSPKTAETYAVQCTSCLKLAREVCTFDPDAQSLDGASENVTERWQQICSQLASALQGAEYLANRDKTIAADYTFPQLFAYFTTSDQKVKDRYLEKFTAKSDEYIKLHEDFIRNMQEAKQMAVDLSNLTPSSELP